MRSVSVILILGIALLAPAAATFAGPGEEPFAIELEPVAVQQRSTGERIARYSPRTIVAAIEIDRDGARLVGYTVKPRPYEQLVVEKAEAYDPSWNARVEVALLGPDPVRYSRHVDVPFLCLKHPGDDEPHLEGDTVWPHRTVVTVELPEVAGFDRIEVGYDSPSKAAPGSLTLATARLGIDEFDRAGGKLAYRDLLFADPEAAPSKALLGSTVQWPEDFDDPDLLKIYGNESEVDTRINVLLVPDGYTYAQKALMEAHADAIVAEFRAGSPHMEHDAFYNYILVYAYSLESGSDQCDCDVITNSAMGTYFPLNTAQCGSSNNRCIWYGSSGNGACDSGGLSNVAAAELRAPKKDVTLIMANTTRYGGCAGDRAVFSAAHALGPEVAVHESGHAWVGLADEYGGAGCGSTAREVNTSTDPVDGAWPEWVADLGLPREGGQTFNQCIYRPLPGCIMNGFGDPFCPVCKQRWALETFDHPAIKPNAPVTSSMPETAFGTTPGQSVEFSVTTRLAQGPGVQNDITWTLTGPGHPAPGTVLAEGTTTLNHAFTAEGSYELKCRVAADANFIKPQKYASNVDTVTWFVNVATSPPAEIEVPIGFFNKQLLLWDAVPSDDYNVYRGSVAELPASYGTCFASGLDWTNSFVFDAEVPPSGTIWTYLVTAVGGAGEGSLGTDSFGNERVNANPCP